MATSRLRRFVLVTLAVCMIGCGTLPTTVGASTRDQAIAGLGWRINVPKGWHATRGDQNIAEFISNEKIGDLHARASIVVKPKKVKIDALRDVVSPYRSDKKRYDVEHDIDIDLKEKKGHLFIVQDRSNDRVVGHYVVISDHIYVMTCSGDDDARLRLLSACVDVLNGIKLEK